MGIRYNWIDSARGLGIFLVVYAHNYPILEHYIYSFHIPLFFFISGMFHPQRVNLKSIKHRAKNLLVPYFTLSFFLYVFWYFLGRHYGNSLEHNLEPLKNFIGIFYAQGDIQFMDWGIPMWFIPCIFVTFLLFSFAKCFKGKLEYFVLSLLIVLGFIYPVLFEFKLPWSLDVACVSLVFYSLGNYFKKKMLEFNFTKIKTILLALIFISISAALLNLKVDMYRSQYGNPVYFILGGLSGTLFVLIFLKIFKPIKPLIFLGKNTIPVLAFQFRALTLIKLILLYLGMSSFSFNEPTKLFLAIIQIIIILPIIYFINKYLPILNGKSAK